MTAVGSLSLILFSAMLLAAQTAAVEHTERCAIEGVVVAAGSGAPLAEAEVSISRDDAPGPRVVVRTDAAGHYAADGLEPGRYSLYVDRTGYVPQMYGQHGTHPEGIALTLGPGKRLQGIDFRLIATGVVGGRVFGQDGEPLVRAAVQAFRPQYFRGKRRLMAGAGPARTNDLGEYRIYGLAPGRYCVGVSGQGADETPTARPKGAPAEERYLPTLYPNATDLDRATMVDVQPGGEAQGIDIVALKSRTFHVRGRIPDLGQRIRTPVCSWRRRGPGR
jgi:protocatechuate 3,4-dioxygenase beta subunit